MKPSGDRTTARVRVKRGVALAACAAALAAYFLSGPDTEGATGPLAAWVSQRYVEATHGLKFDALGRLVSDARKTEIACPAQDADTAVIVALGQSNAANTSTQKFVSLHGARIVSFFHGHCTIARSPLLGASGDGGEQWTALANHLIADGRYKRVVIVSAAINASLVRRWSDGDLTPVLNETLDSLAGVYKATAVIWQQGEADLLLGVSAADYRDAVRRVAARVREKGVDAPFYVSVITRCLLGVTEWDRDNPIARAQRDMADAKLGIVAGVAADDLLKPSDRYDGCHLAGSGVKALARAWAQVFEAKP